MSRVKEKSIVWNSFDKIDNETVRCKLCSTVLTYKGASTGAMLNHLKGKHPSVNVKKNPETSAKQSKLSSFLTRSKKCSTKRAEKITGLVVQMIVKDMLPLNMVENDGFKDLIKFIEPEYVVPCAKTIKTRVVQLHASLKETLKGKIEKEATEMALTTDCWTSLMTQSYLTVTAHYFNKWNLQTIVLETSAFQERHTAENLAKEITRITKEWKIHENVVAIVHDNAANINAATALTEFPKVNCAAHTLQLAINDGFKESREMSKVIAAASKLVGHFKHSTVATQGLQKKQEEMNLKHLKLTQKCDTRWNSVYDMLDRLKVNRWPITAVLSDRMLTKQQDARCLELRDCWWNLLEEMCMVLKPLQMVTTVLCKEENVSLSVSLPVIRGLQTNHLKIKDGDSKHISEFKRTVARNLKERFTFSERLPLLASMLDPRHKQLKFATAIERSLAKNELAELVAVEQQKQKGISATAAKRRRNENESTHEVKSAMEFLLGEDYVQHDPSENSSLEENHEIELFLNDPSVELSDDPLQWWDANEKRFPCLAKIARKFLVVPATSVPSERIFSKAGLIVNKKRCRLLHSTVDKLIFLNKNL